MRPSEICVLGAGVVGRRIAAALAAAGVPHRLASRHGGAGIVTADAFDAGQLAAAVANTAVVINAAGPLRETAAPVLVAALTAGAHYVDVGGEQATLQALYERHESTVRRAGLIALPGAGVDCVLGDLAAAWAAAHLCELPDAGDPIRHAPAPRIAEERPLDDISTSYVFDDLTLSAGSQSALFGGVGQRAMVWRRDRWEPGRTGDKRRVNAGTAMGGERDAIAHAAGDPITIPRHVSANLVTSYVSTTRDPASGALLRLLSTAASLLPKAAQGMLAPYAPPEADLARARFAVVAQVRRGFSAAQVVVRGRDPYTTTAAIAAWCARALAGRGAGPVGMRAPGELFRAEPALRELATAAELAIEPSWG
jgi:hypothetical protein